MYYFKTVINTDSSLGKTKSMTEHHVLAMQVSA